MGSQAKNSPSGEHFAFILAAKILRLVEDSGANKQEAESALNAAVALAPSCLTSFGPVRVVALNSEDTGRLFGQ
jgi:hypothetical protein